MLSAKIASININGLSTPTRVGMLLDFIRRHDLDFVFLQEVTDPAILNVTGYATYLNIGANIRGTAILAKHDFPLTNVTSLPTGRAIAADYNGIRLVNVYAPAGTARRADRERFFISELPALFYATSQSVLLGGDFNCVLHPIDTTGPFTTSRALSEVVRGLALSDAWSQDPQRPAYTHYSPNSATRIDRFYITQDLLLRKTGTEILPAAFTDHNAVVLRLSVPTLGTGWRRGRWKMNPQMVTEAAVKDKIQCAWARWRQSRRYYVDELMWWERCVKPQLKRLLRQEEAERRANYRNMENHLYECLYDILRSNDPATDKLPALQRYKAKLVRLHAERGNKALLDTKEHDLFEGEEPSLFHVLRILRRRENRDIRQVTDEHGNTHSTFRDIAATFVTHLRRKYQPIAVDETALDTLRNFLHPVCQTAYTEQLEQPITNDELLAALRAGARRKSPGIDGLSLEFYTANWETVRSELLLLLNHMFLDKHISQRQKHGILVCLPKSTSPRTPEDYRPISLLTTEYKLLARILARRLRHISLTSCGTAIFAVYRAILYRTLYPVYATSLPTQRPLALLYAS